MTGRGQAVDVGPRERGHRSPGRAGAVGAVAGLAALLLYVGTGARGVEWQDSGVHQYRIVVGQLEHPRGLALVHPLHYWCGRAALWGLPGDPVHKINLMSGAFGAVAVGVVAGLVARLTRSAVAGAAAAAALALAHSFWQMSAVSETYTVAAALMTTEWVLLWRYVRTRRPAWLVAVFAVNGLHVADHLLGLLTLATYGVLLLERFARRRVRLGTVATAAIAWLITAAPYWGLVVAQYGRTGELGATLREALFGGGAGVEGFAGPVLNTRLSLAQLKLAFMTYAYCFPSVTIPVALWGLLQRAGGRKRLFRRVLLAQTVLIVVFVGRYSIKDLYTYFVPVCAVTTLWFGWGGARLWRARLVPRARVALGALLVLNAVLPLGVYLVFPRLAESRGWLRAQMRDIPYRNEYDHFLRPWRMMDDSAARMARAALEQVGAGGWIIADSTTAPPVAVEYLVHGGPPGVHVYWLRDGLTGGREPLTDEALRRHVAAGGRTILVPSSQVGHLVPAPLRIEKSVPFWTVVAPE